MGKQGGGKLMKTAASKPVRPQDLGLPAKPPPGGKFVNKPIRLDQ